MNFDSIIKTSPRLYVDQKKKRRLQSTDLSVFVAHLICICLFEFIIIVFLGCAAV